MGGLPILNAKNRQKVQNYRMRSERNELKRSQQQQQQQQERGSSPLPTTSSNSSSMDESPFICAEILRECEGVIVCGGCYKGRNYYGVMLTGDGPNGTPGPLVDEVTRFRSSISSYQDSPKTDQWISALSDRVSSNGIQLRKRNYMKIHGRMLCASCMMPVPENETIPRRHFVNPNQRKLLMKPRDQPRQHIVAQLNNGTPVTTRHSPHTAHSQRKQIIDKIIGVDEMELGSVSSLIKDEISEVTETDVVNKADQYADNNMPVRSTNKRKAYKPREACNIVMPAGVDPFEPEFDFNSEFIVHGCKFEENQHTSSVSKKSSSMATSPDTTIDMDDEATTLRRQQPFQIIETELMYNKSTSAVPTEFSDSSIALKSDIKEYDHQQHRISSALSPTPSGQINYTAISSTSSNASSVASSSASTKIITNATKICFKSEKIRNAFLPSYRILETRSGGLHMKLVRQPNEDKKRLMNINTKNILRPKSPAVTAVQYVSEATKSSEVELKSTTTPRKLIPQKASAVNVCNSFFNDISHEKYASSANSSTNSDDAAQKDVMDSLLLHSGGCAPVTATVAVPQEEPNRRSESFYPPSPSHIGTSLKSFKDNLNKALDSVISSKEVNGDINVSGTKYKTNYEKKNLTASSSSTSSSRRTSRAGDDLTDPFCMYVMQADVNSTELPPTNNSFNSVNHSNSSCSNKDDTSSLVSSNNQFINVKDEPNSPTIVITSISNEDIKRTPIIVNPRSYPPIKLILKPVKTTKHSASPLHPPSSSSNRSVIHSPDIQQPDSPSTASSDIVNAANTSRHSNESAKVTKHVRRWSRSSAASSEQKFTKDDVMDESDVEGSDQNLYGLKCGDVVWAKNGTDAYWPGRVNSFARSAHKLGASILWFGAATYSPFIDFNRIEPFVDCYANRFNPKRAETTYHKAVALGISECLPRRGYFEQKLSQQVHKVLISTHGFDPSEQVNIITKRKRRSANVHASHKRRRVVKKNNERESARLEEITEAVKENNGVKQKRISEKHLSSSTVNPPPKTNHEAAVMLGLEQESNISDDEDRLIIACDDD